MALVFDIETVGFQFESLSESQQEYILRYAEKERDEEFREEKIRDAKRYLSLYPFTAKVVVIGMLNTVTGNSLILYENPEEEDYKPEEKTVSYKGIPEDKMISAFWDYVSKVDRVVTFNGRMFDIPFMMMRSAALNIKPSINLLTSRYDTSQHIDLLEQFTFHGLLRKFNLDFYCHAFGVESPKSKGVSGMDVKELYRAGKIKEIAVYCGDDIRSTYELYKIWDEFLNI